MKKTNIFIFIVILASFVIGAYFYPQFPARIASHWNAQGQVDGYMSRGWGLFLLPIILLVMWLMFILIPKIDPMKKNIEKFRKYFDAFIALIVLFLFYVYVLTIFWNMGKRFDMGQALMPAMGILFYFAGVLLKHAKRNWFVGIRTPWTLSSDNVWDKTHQLGAKLFKIAGIIAFLGIFFPKISFWFVIIPVILFAIFVSGYSYIEYKKEEKK
jgi:uncharacterized membrane protein